MPPDGPIAIEGSDANVAQLGIIDDWVALLPYAVGPKSGIGPEEVVIPLALPHVLCRGLVRSARRVRLAREGDRPYRRSRQTHNCRCDRALSLGSGTNEPI
jgi:hypothetical protein